MDTIIGVDPMQFGLDKDEWDNQKVIQSFLNQIPVPLSFFDPNQPSHYQIINCVFEADKGAFVGDIFDGINIIGNFDANIGTAV